jgi:hypothetical protein
VDVAAHYRRLVQLGRDGFVAAAAPAALVRTNVLAVGDDSGAITLTLDDDLDAQTVAVSKIDLDGDSAGELEIHPLAKKAGASFADRITIGRTSNNDVTIVDHSVSRLHAYVRKADKGWVVADAGSKNGSWLRGEPLEARKERPIESRAILRLGDIELTFYVAADLYAALGGR